MALLNHVDCEYRQWCCGPLRHRQLVTFRLDKADMVEYLGYLDLECDLS